MAKEVSVGLQGIIAQMLKPLKDLPLGIVIEALSGYKVIPFDPHDKKDKELLMKLQKVALLTGKKVNEKGIHRPRPNEVGNDIEPYVKDALQEVGYKTDTPTTKSGKKKSTGYPDIIFWDSHNRVSYIECKTYNISNVDTTQRSFYLSPSDDFKVTHESRHFGLCFEIIVKGSTGNNHKYMCKSWKLINLEKLELDVKYEFNSDNQRMYDKRLILAEGNI